MSVWDKFNKLTKLDFAYQDLTPGVIPQIYANTRNQVDIVISIGVNGIDGKPLNLNEDDFKDLLYLCDSITGERISSPWILSDKKNEYTKAVNHAGHNIAKRETSEFIYVHRYILLEK